MAINSEGPQFDGQKNLATWAVEDRLPWLVENLGLTAGAICGSVSEPVRRKVYSLEHDGKLPASIDWSRNGIVISPPGTGKGMAIFVEALAHFERVLVLVPSVIQAHKLEESLDVLYNEDVGGCKTSQRTSPGLISVITTGIFHQMVKDSTSDLWKEGTVLCVDEAQRILEQDTLTEFMVGVAASRGVRTMIVSATIAPSTLPKVYGHPGSPALVYDLVKQMHPVEISQIPAEHGKELTVLAETGAFSEAGKTTLVFIASRRGVMGTTKALRKMHQKGEITAWVVPVTGNHMVADQLEQIRLRQKGGEPVVVVATPGTMDSSVTIPGLSLVVILDRRVRVDWNRYGVRERWSERLPINHIWQMIRRVGRQKRDDGKRDQVYVIGDGRRTDILAETPVFAPIEGCSKWTPLEELLLAAVYLDVPFKDVHEYMVSSFPEDAIDAHTGRLREAGMIEDAPEEGAGSDGLRLTDKGRLTIKQPYTYRWARLIVESPKEQWPQLALLASFGYLDDLEMFEEGDIEEDKSSSEMLAKLELGIEYLAEHHDHRQYAMAEELGFSFRRLEQVETIFELGCRALALPFAPPAMPAGAAERELLKRVVLGGIEVGLFQPFFPAKDEKGWSDPRETPDGKVRRHFFPDERLELARHAKDGMVCVVGTPTWFTMRGGQPAANVNDVTIVPERLVPGILKEVAEREEWFRLTFKAGEHRGRVQYSVVQGGRRYVVSRLDAAAVPGREYWCSIDCEIARGVTAVIVHYPVLEG